MVAFDGIGMLHHSDYITELLLDMLGINCITITKADVNGSAEAAFPGGTG